MSILKHFIQIFNNLFGDYSFLLAIEILAFTIKGIFFTKIIQNLKKTSLKTTTIALTFAILCSMLINFSWIIKLLQLTNIIYISKLLLHFTIRISWAGNVIFYQLLLIFLDGLVRNNQKISFLNKILAISTTVIFAPMIFLAIKLRFLLIIIKN